MEVGEGQHYIIAYPGMYTPMDAYIPPMMPTVYWILGIQGGEGQGSSKLHQAPAFISPSPPVRVAQLRVRVTVRK